MTDDSGKGVANEDCTLSKDVIQLFNSAGVQDVNEAITVLFHAFVLESGFIPKDVPPEDKYRCMPQDWNVKGVFKIKYVHFCCPSYTCYMTCVPLYSTISAHGIICDLDCSESVDIKVNVNNFLKDRDRKDILSLTKAFSNLEELSKCFKDDFCLPLLNLLHETIGKSPLLGLRGLFDELKIYILQLLPVEGVISMSAVNKNFNDLANSPFLWKYLYERDFAKDGVPDIDTSSSSDANWKRMYIQKYKNKNRKEGRPFMMPRYRLPQIFNIGPDFDTDFDTDIGIHFDPPPPEFFFPPLQNMFPMFPRHPFLRRF